MGALEDRRWLVLTFVCLVLSVDLPMILFHTYVKLKFEKRVSADDLVIALADLLWIGYIICQVAACMNGFGAHAADLSKEFHYINSSSARNGDLAEALRFWYLTTLFHVLSSAAARICIGLASMSRKAFPSRRRLVTINLIISTSTSILFFFLLLFQCTPISAYWSRDRAAAHASCYTAQLAVPWYVFLGVSMAADGVLMSFAVASAMGMRPGQSGKLAERVAAGFFNLFAFGHVVATAIQITYVPGLTNLDDVTWTATPFALPFLLGPSFALLGAHASKVAPVVHAHRASLSVSSTTTTTTTTTTGTTGSINNNRDSLVRELLRERKEEERSRMKGKKNRSRNDGVGGVVGGGRLVVLSGREGDRDEDAALAAVVESGLARLMEEEEERRRREGGGGGGGGGGGAGMGADGCA
ncbi:Fmn-dependent dehydrogenase family protein [Lasiodiplodia theobromae]|uniref:Fmn-dependent dehydrogenase family protein n=1 Tax=Lasiodiplodia theobromae TaxID=45133 RepID=UPI0015C3ED31|nr:Fmn-dependent dehydrogenase family protein [Lasiodiplodia theobromae]KAF4537203.1 Fmn-dependent dehydrogenase family protein [Lasiodiplodia theobromae]